MARDDDPWRRFREREDEREEEEKQALRQTTKPGSQSEFGAQPAGKASSSAQLDMLLEQARSMIEQVGSLYQMYLVGIEKLPPVEKRKQLEILINTITRSPKTTQSIQFRTNTLLATFTTHRDKWDRMLRDLESGKIKRQVKAR